MTDPTPIDAMMVLLVAVSVVAAVLGKLVGDGLPSRVLLGGGGAAIIVSAATCLLPPLVLYPLLGPAGKLKRKST